MSLPLLLLLLLPPPLPPLPPPPLPPPPLLHTMDGPIRGTHVPPSVAYLGIPYGRPPLGPLRFRPPLPAPKWTSPLDASSHRNVCYQAVDTMFPGFGGAEMWNPNRAMSEDCLYLNVWIPYPPPPQLMPVMVWIYGGGFYSGAASLDVYDGRILAASQRVVVVSMNYRVGALGFLALPGHPDAPGNAGLWDQRLALQWIQRNIRVFGGDPNAVTLFGESAGAASIGIHLLSPGSREYFHRAILQSGSPNGPWATIDPNEGRRRALKLGMALGCIGNDTEVVMCLRERPAPELVEGEGVVMPQDSVFRFPFVPVVDGEFLRDSPEVLLGAGMDGGGGGSHGNPAGSHGADAGSHGNAPGTHSNAAGIHGAGAGSHGNAPGTHGNAAGIHGTPIGIHGNAPGTHGNAAGTHATDARIHGNDAGTQGSIYGGTQGTDAGIHGNPAGIHATDAGIHGNAPGTQGSIYGSLHGTDAGIHGNPTGIHGNDAGTQGSIYSGTQGTDAGIHGNPTGIHSNDAGTQGSIYSGTQGTDAGIHGNPTGIHSNDAGTQGTDAGIHGNPAGIHATDARIHGNPTGIHGNAPVPHPPPGPRPPTAIDILLGAVRDEGTYFLVYGVPGFGKDNESLISRDEFLHGVRMGVPQGDEVVAAAVELQYTDWLDQENPVKNREALGAIVGDHNVVCPLMEFAGRWALWGRVYVYLFEHRASTLLWPQWMGVPHGYEIEFVFGQPLRPELNYTEEEKGLSRRMMEYWGNFARTGDPNGPNDSGPSRWPQFTLRGQGYARLNTAPLSQAKGLRAQACAFWTRFLPKLMHATGKGDMGSMGSMGSMGCMGCVGSVGCMGCMGCMGYGVYGVWGQAQACAFWTRFLPKLMHATGKGDMGSMGSVGSMGSMGSMGSVGSMGWDMGYGVWGQAQACAFWTRFLPKLMHATGKGDMGSMGCMGCMGSVGCMGSMGSMGYGVWGQAQACAFWTRFLPKLMHATGPMEEAEHQWRQEFHRWSSYMGRWQSHFEHYSRMGQCQQL
uniref:Acetylcholinesterase n=1 Tax=Melopsittacus undulatus TaxID=13146 RepID=A0A8V5GQY8_MELUD